MRTLTLPRLPEQRSLPSRLHHPRVAARLGAWLTVAGVTMMGVLVVAVTRRRRSGGPGARRR